MNTKLKLQPIAAGTSLQDHVYQILLQAILEMDIYDEMADLHLDERSLAENLNVSRTPLRATLLRLEQEGFVKIQPRRGIFVLRKSLSEILDMITVWAALESMAARLLATKASDAELSMLRVKTLQFSVDRASTRIAEYSENNINFHTEILKLSGCQLLADLAGGLFLHMRAVRRRAMHESDRAKRSVSDHLEIIEALETRDPERAAQAVHDHTMRLYVHIRESWTEMEQMHRCQ